jgi:hypothetical protein
MDMFQFFEKGMRGGTSYIAPDTQKQITNICQPMMKRRTAAT